MNPAKLMNTVMTAAALGAFALTTSVRAQEVEIPLDQLPRAVADAAKAKFPGAKWREAAKETEDGKTLYEIAMTHADHKMDVTFEVNGTLVLVETEVPEAELPPAVSKAVKGKYPGAKIGLAESVKKGPELKHTVDYYEMHLTTADKKSVEVEVDGHGKILKTEEGGNEEAKG
jgi:uncharacterized membrane protein YkoI